MKKSGLKTVVIAAMLVCPCAAAFSQPPSMVKVAKVVEKEVAKVNRIMGVVDFDKRSGISPEISGLIAKQSVVEGALVKKGDVLVRLNTDFIRKNIEIMKKQVEQAEIRIQNTEKNLKRYEILFEKKATSEKVYEDLSDSHRELLKQRDILRTNIERLELEKRKSVIRAPFDGLILEKLKNEGEWVKPGEAVCSLASTEDMHVKVAVSEDLVKFIVPGNKVSLEINALGREFTGVVGKYVPVADIQSKTFQVKIAVPYFKEAIQNMSASVNVPVSDKMKLRLVKRDALVRFNGKDFVYTVKDGKAAILPVNIVAYEGEYIGLDNPYIVPGMNVVVDGNDRLVPDQPVKVIDGNGGKKPGGN